MLAALRGFLGSRWRVVAVVASMALATTCAAGPPPKSTVEGLAAAMSQASGAVAEKSGLAWEPSGGWLADLFVGRKLLFAAQEPGALKDVYRALVPVTPEGQLLRARGVVNLTATDEADETGLLTVGERATYTTVARGVVSTVSLMELGGGANAWWERLGQGLLDESALLAGFRRVHFAVGAGRAEVALDESSLSIDLGSDRPRRFVFESEGFEEGADKGLPHWIQPEVLPETSSPITRWLGLAASESEPAVRITPPTAEAGVTSEQAPPPTWPPPPLEPFAPGKPATPWEPIGADTPDDPALFHRAQLRLSNDAQHELILVAIDVRRLELRFDGGFARPTSPFGPPGTGRVNPADLPRVAATFDGAVDESGAMAAGRVLVSPEPALATVVVTESDAIGFGAWPHAEHVPSGITSLRQSLTALVADGRPLPAASSSRAARSALCRRLDGQVLYAWSPRATWLDVARGMAHAGCDFALALGAGARAAGFGLTSFDAGSARVHPIAPSMTPPSPEGSAEGYFSLLRKDVVPSDEGVVWRPSLGVQPEPQFSPALLSGKASVGNLELELFAVRPGRVEWKLVGGTEEPLLEGKPAPRRTLDPDEQARVLFALDTGHTTPSTRYGLAFGERQTLPLRSVYPTLALRRDGSIEFSAAGELLEPKDAADYVQLPALLLDGQLTARAAQTGARRRRGAICALPNGRVLVAYVEHDTSAPLAIYLRSAGCDAAFELDRSSQHRASLYREGTPLAPPTEAETTRIVGLSRPMTLNTFSFGSNSKSVPTPTK